MAAFFSLVVRLYTASLAACVLPYVLLALLVAAEVGVSRLGELLAVRSGSATDEDLKWRVYWSTVRFEVT